MDFLLKIKCYKTQNNRKFKQKIVEKSIKIFTTLNFNYLINSIKNLTNKGLVGSCFALAFIAICYEALKLFRDKITKKNVMKKR
jgi:hypothetical protein